MKKYFFLMLFLWVSILSQAQSPLKIQVTMLPPYPTTLSDLQTRSNQVVILVQNLSRQSYTFVLGGELTDDNGVSLKAVPFVGQTTLTVNALQSLRLSANDFSRIFDINKIQVSGIDKNTLIRTGAIPEGSYRLCLRAYDPATLRPISDEEPLGCSNTFPIQSIEPPIILRPQNETEVMISTPQNIQFAWTVPAQAPAGTRYIFRIKELPNGQNPNNIMRLGTPYILEQQTNVNFLNYGSSFPSLVAGRSYAFSVQAVDPTGRTSFRNQGYSEVYQFIYKTPVVRSTDNAIAILVPQKCGSEIKAGENIAFYLRWKPEKATVPERYNLLITNSQKSVMVNKTLNSPYFQEDDMGQLRFNNGATYNFKIQQLDPSNNQVIAEQSCDFVFKKKILFWWLHKDISKGKCNMPILTKLTLTKLPMPIWHCIYK
jgi:TANFOR domain-containing protein